MNKLRSLVTAGLWAFTIPAMSAASSDGLLTLLASKLSEVRSSSSEDRVAAEPVVGVEALQGTTRTVILARLGSPDNCAQIQDAQCSEMNTWVYSFVHLPPGWRGGGPELNISFGQQGIVKAAVWQFSR